MAKDIKVKATLEGGTIPAKANLSSGIVRASADIKDVIIRESGYVPGDYVGPDVPRRGPGDMYSAGAFVYAPAGYYEGLTARSVDISRTLAQPKITVSNTGLITATEAISDGAFYEKGLSAEKTKQLTQQRGKTVTPSDVEQTAVTAGKFTTGDVKVGPIPYTKHEIYFGFADETSVTIPVYCSDAVLTEIITGYTPTTYGGKEVILAQLDGVTWYEKSPIPLNTQLIDFTAITTGYVIDGNGEPYANEYSYCSDFTEIDPSMTFVFKGYQWWNLGFYDESKTFISGGMQDSYKDSVDGEIVTGTLSSANIPPNAAYIRLSSYPYTIADTSTMSLIRTA